MIQTLQLLSPKEEEKVNAVLHHMSETVRRRRLLVYPYFKDYDRVGCMCNKIILFKEIEFFITILIYYED